MDEVFNSLAFRTLGILVLTQLVLFVLKKYKKKLQKNKDALRVCVLGTCAVGAVLIDWLPDGVITSNTITTSFFAAWGASEISYQWLIKKWLTGWVAPKSPRKKKKKKKKKKK